MIPPPLDSLKEVENFLLCSCFIISKMDGVLKSVFKGSKKKKRTFWLERRKQKRRRHRWIITGEEKESDFSNRSKSRIQLGHFFAFLLVSCTTCLQSEWIGSGTHTHRSAHAHTHSWSWLRNENTHTPTRGRTESVCSWDTVPIYVSTLHTRACAEPCDHDMIE